MRLKRRISALLMICALIMPCAAAGAEDLDAQVAETAQYLLETVTEPQIASVGGEWSIIGLARSGEAVPDGYFNAYYRAVEKAVKAEKGVLHDKKYTEYSRVALALTAIGRNPRDVAGYDLIAPLLDVDKTVWQGVNGAAFALIALDSGNYAADTDVRERYLQMILDSQLAGGGFSLQGGGDADPDVTAMVLQALAKYTDRAQVKAAADRAVSCLSALQSDDGGFSSWGADPSESIAQAIVALGELGIATDDPRFVKSGRSLVDNLLDYAVGNGGFAHNAGGKEVNLMATEQAFYALVSIQRTRAGKSSLYRMGDVSPLQQQESAPGLPGKHPDVKPVPETSPGAAFVDVAGHPDQEAILALSRRGIVGGRGSGRFAPDATMTRAEFAAITVRALGLQPKARKAFEDVAADSWYAEYVGTAQAYGIVGGVSAARFAPQATITRQEAAVMVTRAAALCGLDTKLSEDVVRDVLAQFTDYTRCAAWAKDALAFCYGQDFLDQDDMEILPAEAVERCEIARMLYRLLDAAALL